MFQKLLRIRGFIINVSLWSILIGISLIWNIHNENNQVTELASIAAQENFNKDQAFRQWGTLHGGIYVKPDKRTPPNPYLAHLPHRDVVTKDGVKLTLMNPAYMLRQLMTEYDELYGVKAKITGLVLLNPINAPDKWEKKALHEFSNGVKEITSTENIDGKPYLRLMRPMFMTKGCVKCHGHLGFKEGDLRGGVGVAIPLEPYLASGANEIAAVYISHGIIWIFGLTGLSFFYSYVQKHETEKQKTQQLEKDVKAAEEANKAKSEFLSHMSHELRTPLNAILGFAQMLQLDSEKFNTTQSENVNEILDAGNHLLLLINDLLDLARIESGKMTLSLEKCHIGDLVQQCISLIQPQVRDRGIKVVSNTSFNDDIVIKADETRLKQVLLNLLSNAAKYNNDNGKITIETKIIQDERLRICVTDTGKGLNDEELSQLFSAFERLNVKENVEGTGIGLIITKHLIELMGGSVGVESTVGKGSTFWIELNLHHEVDDTTENS